MKCSYVNRQAFEFTSGTLDELTSYTFHTNTYLHHFCPVCGTEVIIEDSGEKRQDQPAIGINVRTVDDIDLDKLKLDVSDGKTLL